MSNRNKAKENILFITWTISVIAMLGSLYFSEIRGYEPCELCWYQRILMYPLVVILGIANIRKDFQAAIYVAVISFIGGMVSLYHYSIQKIPFFTDNALSCGRVPCTGMYINWFEFVTIPFLALIAFILIFTLCIVIIKKKKEATLI